MTDVVQPAVQVFKRLHGTVPTHRIVVPVCVPWLGLATLAHGGLLLASAGGAGTAVVCSPRSDAWIELASTEQDRTRFRPHALEGDAPSPALEVVRKVLRQLRAEKIHFSGFNAVVRQEVPGPLEVFAAPALAAATTLAMRQLYPFALGESGLRTPPRPDERGRLPDPGGAERMRLGQLAARALGINAPALVLAVLEARPGQLVSVDAWSGTVESVPLPGLVAVLSRATAEATEVALGMEARERQLENWGLEAARKLNLAKLRTLEMRDLSSRRPRLTPSEYAAARLLLEEIARTVAAERALREGDEAQFGQYLLESLGTQTGSSGADDDTGRVIATARQFPGCLGSIRLPGGAAHLVRHHATPAFTEALSRLHPEARFEVLAPKA
jgi:galactokinase